MTVGILAFHGDFAEHIDLLGSMGVHSIEVRSLKDLEKVDRLIIPGGESTVMARFLEETGVGEEIRRRVEGKSAKGQEGKIEHPLAVFGTCAGAILVAKNATGKKAPPPLRLIDIDVDRNAYGTQMNSFETEIKVRGLKRPLPAAFIRAPKITRVGSSVEILSVHDSTPVLVRQGRVLAATFHTEVRGERALHEMFLRMS
ncbi:glutamine amidotransferase subunit PdxT [Candidatus Peribacteria bacterium RIFCSPLOWO2_02_FULL_51_10]|nr:MAG: glutamine amidotransferase subunit PdxT [Candidatus Peribacteria bacterium RIFCSPLOWO2_02_FULL_51_10]